MGLVEKRLAEEIKTDKLPAFEQTLQTLAGYPIQVAIDWATFTAYDQYPLTRLDIVFSDLESFVKKICTDEMGKEALQEKMTTIRLINTEDQGQVQMELKDYTLSLTMRLVGDTFSSQTDSQIADYVETLL